MRDVFSVDLVNTFKNQYLRFVQKAPEQAHNFFVRGLPLSRRDIPERRLLRHTEEAMDLPSLTISCRV
jgi:hypothetical protein